MTCSQIWQSTLGPDRQLSYFTNLKKQDCFWIGVFLFPPILWGRWSHDHPLEHLAKFGYRSDRKVENFRNPDILFWWHAETYSLNLTISEKKSLNSDTLGHFFQENPFYEWHWLFFFHQAEKFCPNKKRCWWLEDYPIRGLSRLGPPLPTCLSTGCLLTYLLMGYLPIYPLMNYLPIFIYLLTHLLMQDRDHEKSTWGLHRIYSWAYLRDTNDNL
jgi:hypothetical protein